MRDRDYEMIPSPGTYRIVILGSSIVMGSGVADHEVFESLLEDRLNQIYGGQSFTNFEILNFGVASHASLQGLYVLEEAALQFNPNAVFLIVHQNEETDFIPGLTNRIRNGVKIPYPEINNILQRAGIVARMSKEEVERRLLPFAGEIITRIYERMVALAKERNILPVWVFIPTPEFRESEQDYKAILMRAQNAGFVTIGLFDLYDGQVVNSLIVAEWDLHPNRRGHQLISDRLYEALLASKQIRNALGIAD
jgi:hypothetical protein